jgi:uncharacterized protein YjbI with pentapeptide repeats
MKFRSLAAAAMATVALAVGVVLGRWFSRSPQGQHSAIRDTAEPVAAALPASAEAASQPALLTTATTPREAPVRLDWLLPLLGMVGLLLTIALVAWSALGLRPPIPAATPSWPFVTTLGTLIIWAVYLFWKVPQWQATARRGKGGLGEKELFDIENAARGTIGQMLGGVAVISGLLFAWQQLGNTAETLRVSQQGQITERFTRAVDQLGSDDVTIRLGGIYALDRIAGDSPQDYVPAMQVLASYVRGDSSRTAAVSTPGLAGSAGRDLPIDVQAVLTILGGRSVPWPAPRCLDLSGADLAFANLTNANLVGICLERTDLANANLAGADLRGTTMSGANLTHADLTGANLSLAVLDSAVLRMASMAGANLTEANLLNADARGAILPNADLRGANLTGANLSSATLFQVNLTGALLLDADLSGALLSGADLSGANVTNAVLVGAYLADARGLTSEQIDAAQIDGTTQLPTGLLATPAP